MSADGLLATTVSAATRDPQPPRPDRERAHRFYIAVRSDLQMGKGKAIAQAVHAFRLSGAVLEDHTPIICVRAESEEALRLLSVEAHDLHIPCFVVRDAGHTQNAPGTFTCAAIGPAESFGPRLVASRLY